MLEKKCFISEKIFYITLIMILLSSFMILSCEKEKVQGTDPNTLPLAIFSHQIQYRTHTDGNTYAFVTAQNNSGNSNRWGWNRPGSKEEISGPPKFVTDRDTAVTQVYAATNKEQEFQITLIAYSDVIPNPEKPDSVITFTSNPCVRTIHVKKPE